jgi:hypothetical protein
MPCNNCLAGAAGNLENQTKSNQIKSTLLSNIGNLGVVP